MVIDLGKRLVVVPSVIMDIGLRAKSSECQRRGEGGVLITNAYYQSIGAGVRRTTWKGSARSRAALYE